MILPMIRLALRITIALAVSLLLGPRAEAQTIGSSLVSFLKSKLGTRVGGGECSQMATGALRVGAAELIPNDLGADAPNAGDYVWGKLVTVISCSNKTWSDSNHSVACEP